MIFYEFIYEKYPTLARSTAIINHRQYKPTMKKFNNNKIRIHVQKNLHFSCFVKCVNESEPNSKQFSLWITYKILLSNSKLSNFVLLNFVKYLSKMKLTQILFRRNRLPNGHLFRGKDRLVKQVEPKHLRTLRQEFEVEEKNMFYLRFPYLTEVCYDLCYS